MPFLTTWRWRVKSKNYTGKSKENSERQRKNALRPKAKFLSIIGSYGWGGKTVETLAGMIPNLNVEVLDPVLCKGVPSEAVFEALDRLAGTIAQKHEENDFK